MADPRLRGQDVSLKAIAGGQLVTAINSVATFNDSVMFEIKEDGFLGEVANRYDEVLSGYSGDVEMQVNTAKWLNYVQQIEQRASRQQPALVFNMVRTDFFANGDSAVITYNDVHFGPLPTTFGGRADFAKVKLEFKCTTRTVQINSIL